LEEETLVPISNGLGRIVNLNYLFLLFIIRMSESSNRNLKVMTRATIAQFPT
jgi:hypothetical protein